VPDSLNNLVANLIFIFQRLNWWSLVDIFLVAAVFFGILRLLRGTQAMVLLRGAILLIALLGLLTSLDVLPAFSWLVRTTLPAMLLAIPVIFAPEIRHGLERLGRAGAFRPVERGTLRREDTIHAIVMAAARLSDRQHGALIILKRHDSLDEYIRTGVPLDARLTTELLLQIFYPNTPLHDGAALISDSYIIAAACVLPLSASGVLTDSPDRKMGLRHRAALGISEVSDAIAVVVSEETGSMSVVQGGKVIRRLDIERLENVLRAFFPSPVSRGFWSKVAVHLFPGKKSNNVEESKW
jgi:diadenylate cyclase